MLKPLPWQGGTWQVFSAAIAENRLGHALLITGSPGAGKQLLARCLAAALWCRTPGKNAMPCGHCADCRQVISEAHSGFHILRVEEDKRDISIEAVRELIEKLHMTSHDGRAKVAIVDPVDALNANGANALLKTIEEPAPRSHLILVSERPQALPATIRSRCQRIRVAMPGKAQALAWLQAQPDLDASEAVLEQALLVAQGSPQQARSLIETKTLQMYSGWSKHLIELAEGKSDPVTVAATIGETNALSFSHWLYGWLAGLLRARLISVAPGDERLAQLACVLPPGLLDRYIGDVQEGLYRVRTNANKVLLLESLLIGWIGLLARASRTQQNAA